jgi:hypothetical protein
MAVQLLLDLLLLLAAVVLLKRFYIQIFRVNLEVQVEVVMVQTRQVTQVELQ